MRAEKPKEEAKKDEPAAKGGGGKKGVVGALIGALISAVLSGGAAFGGVKFASKASSQENAPPAAPMIPVVRAPGPTVPLEAFVANVSDSEGKTRAAKITVNIELQHGASDADFKLFIPRVRDATLSYLRGVQFEQLQKPEGVEQLRKDLIARYHSVGAIKAEQVLITDLITQ